MAGWKGYTDKVLAKKHVSGIGIYGPNGATWGYSGTGIDAKKETIEAWYKGLTDDKSVAKLRETGVTNGALKYIILSAVPKDQLIGKKGNAGICMAYGAKSFVIGVYTETSGIQPPQCVGAVLALVEELKKKGF